MFHYFAVVGPEGIRVPRHRSERERLERAAVVQYLRRALAGGQHWKVRVHGPVRRDFVALVRIRHFVAIQLARRLRGRSGRVENPAVEVERALEPVPVQNIYHLDIRPNAVVKRESQCRFPAARPGHLP